MDDKSVENNPSSDQVVNLPTPTVSSAKSEKPLSGLFAINKPSGVLSMTLLESLKDLFLTSKLFVENPEPYHVQPDKSGKKKNRFRRKKQQLKLIKIGQGGTLDPLASGVLIIGLNSATKKLSEFLNCTKVYRTTGILGCKTDSYDCDGKITGLASWKHVQAEDIEKQCQLIKGEHWQIPPLYSALKMDGKPLYEYARKNIPLPRPIEARKCEIFDIKMTEWKEPGSHSYEWPTEKISEEDGKILKQVEIFINQTGVNKPSNSKAEEQIQPTSDHQNPGVSKPLTFKSEEPSQPTPDHENLISQTEVSKPLNSKTEEQRRPTPDLKNLMNQTEVSKPLNFKTEEQSQPTSDHENQLNKSTLKRSASLENSEPDSKKNKLNDVPIKAEPSEIALPTAPDEIDNRVDEVNLEENRNAPAFTLEMTVSSGTYVRSIVHDIGQAVSSAATIVSLIRTRQGRFSIQDHSDDKSSSSAPVTTDNPEKNFGCIEWSVFENAIQAQKNGSVDPCNQDGWREWEQVLLKHVQT